MPRVSFIEKKRTGRADRSVLLDLFDLSLGQFALDFSINRRAYLQIKAYVKIREAWGSFVHPLWWIFWQEIFCYPIKNVGRYRFGAGVYYRPTSNLYAPTLPYVTRTVARWRHRLHILIHILNLSWFMWKIKFLWMIDVCSLRSTEAKAGAEVMELGDRRSCQAPSVHTRVTSVNSRLHLSKHRRGPANHSPRPHFGPSVFDVGSSAISATNDNVDLSGEFFCQAPEQSSVGRARGGLAAMARPTASIFRPTQDRHKLGNFGDGFLPQLQEYDGIPGEGIPEFDVDDMSVNSIGLPRCGLRCEQRTARTGRHDDASCSTAPANARDFPVSWPVVNTTGSRPRVEATRPSLCQEEPIPADHRWLASGRGPVTGSYLTSRPRGRLISELNFGDDDPSSSSQSSLEQPVRIHRSGSDHSSPSLFRPHAEILPFNEYFTSSVNTLSCV